MAELHQKPAVAVEIVLRLTEAEARAMDALVGYGSKAFLEVFYKHMGQHYMRPHEAGLLSLFESVSKHLPPILKRADDARKAFTNGLTIKVPGQHTPSARDAAP